MIHLEFTQCVYLAALAVGSAVAFSGGQRLIVLVMWANVIATIQFSHAPSALMGIDLLSAVALVAVVRNRAALTIAFIFGVMVFAYRLVEPLGYYTTYTIIDGLAYVQIFAMGSAGFGTGIRIIRRRILRLLASPVHSQISRMDSQGDVSMALGKDTRARVNGR